MSVLRVTQRNSRIANTSVLLSFCRQPIFPFVPFPVYSMNSDCWSLISVQYLVVLPHQPIIISIYTNQLLPHFNHLDIWSSFFHWNESLNIWTRLLLSDYKFISSNIKIIFWISIILSRFCECFLIFVLVTGQICAQVLCCGSDGVFSF